jgi:hypothetical protein
VKSLEPRQIDAIERVLKKPELQPFFFGRLKGLKWFDELQQKMFFDPSANPAPKETDDKGFYVIPLWPVLEYLEKTAPELETEGNKEYANKFLAIIRSTTKSSIESGISNWRTWWYFAKILRHIPIDLITPKDIDLCAYWLNDPFDRMIIGDELGNKFFPRLLNERTDHSRQLSSKLLMSLTQIRWIEKPRGTKNEFKPVLQIEQWHADKLFRNQSQSRKIGKVLGQAGLSIIKARIEEILRKDEKDEYSYIWRPAIEDHDQNKNRNNAANILITAFRDALSGYIEEMAYEISQVSDYISGLLEQKFIVFQRVGIYIVGVYYDLLRSTLNRILEPRFFTSHYKHELFHLLRRNFIKFEDSDKDLVLQIIDSLAVENYDENVDLKTKRKAYKKLVWLTAVKDQGYSPADELFARNYSIIGHEPEHPDFSSYMEVGWVGEISPYTAAELLSRGVDELIDVLKSFKEQGDWKTPTVRGLAEELKLAVKNNPEYFKGNLGIFLSVDLAYIHEIIEAYKELWSEKKYDNWIEVLEFCCNVIYREDFWSESNNQERQSFVANRSWIVGAIGELLRTGTASDDKAFDPALLPKAKALLLSLLEKQESTEFESGCDAVFVSINSARGKCIEALVDFALRSCRLADKEKGRHDYTWKEIEPFFEKELIQSENDNYEFITLIANYLPNFLYLNRDWTLKNLGRIFPLKHRKQWLCAMQGYAYVNAVYPEIYSYLKREGHFLEALNAEDLKGEAKEKVLQNIVVAYIHGEDLLEDNASLINLLIARWNTEELNELISFIWTLRNHDENLCRKVQSLWTKFSKRIAGREDENKQILSSLCLWSTFILEITADNLNLLKQAAPYVDVRYHSYILIEELKRLVDNHPAEVAEIFLSVLQECAPTYDKEEISYILRSLYHVNSLEIRKKANVIVDKYIAYGVEFPAKIREEFVKF